MTSEEIDLEQFRQSSVYTLFPLLQTGIIHRTSIEGYKGIRESGYIIANQGQFPFRYPQSKNSYAYSKQYVSLFDFESATEKQCILTHHTWGQFFSDQKPATIVLKLNRDQVGKDLIPNSVGPKVSSKDYRVKIPYVEVWYPKPIPVSAINSYILAFLNSEKGELIFQEFDTNQINEFNEAISLIEHTWAKALKKRNKSN